MTNLEKAAKDYKERKSRISHPDGKFDSAGRWYPSKNEERECCKYVRQPSRKYPYTLMLHCRTIIHISHLYDVDEKELRKAILCNNHPT